MTDKEFKHLSRAQLIEVIYQLQLKIDELTEKNAKLETELADKRLRISEAGNIADAALVINNCFKNAQAAAEQYLNEIKAIRRETEAECRRMISAAKDEAAAIIVKAKLLPPDNVGAAKESQVKDSSGHSDNG